MTHFSALSLIKNALSGQKNWEPQWPDSEPKAEYDVIIVGAVMYSQRGVLMLAHNVHDVQSFQRHVHANRLNGVDNVWLSAEEAKEYCPPLDISPTARYPVVGAALQRRAGTARHDALAWG